MFGAIHKSITSGYPHGGEPVQPDDLRRYWHTELARHRVFTHTGSSAFQTHVSSFGLSEGDLVSIHGHLDPALMRWHSALTEVLEQSTLDQDWTSHVWVSLGSTPVENKGWGAVASSSVRGRGTSTVPGSIAENWLDLAKSNISVALFSDLMRIASRQSGWNGPGSKPLYAASLTSFLQFWKMVNESASDPEIVLTPKGYLQAEWYRNQRAFLEIDFRAPDESSFFGLFDGRRTIIEGVAPIEQIVNLVRSHKGGRALSWSYGEKDR